jgi:O-antigen ligase
MKPGVLTGWLLAAAVALLPFGRTVEIPMALLALAVVVPLARGQIDLRAPAPLALVALYVAFALPMLLSLVDAVAPGRSALSTLGTLRYFGAGLAILYFTGLASRRETAAVAPAIAPGGAAPVLAILLPAVSALLLIWCLDALLQFFSGRNILGWEYTRGYLNGLFGEDDNLKLAFAIAIFFPLAVTWSMRCLPRWATTLLVSLLVAVVLLTGKRVVWITVILEGACLVLYYLRVGGLGKRGVLAGALLLAVAGVASYQYSDWVEQRTDNVVAAVRQPDYETINRALSLRLPIWETAFGIIGDHWLNGVGPRGFRYVYQDYARSDDRFALDMVDGRPGAQVSHPHQMVLEVLAETGVIGLAGLLVLMFLLLRLWLRAGAAAREAALPFGVSLFGMLFPFNSHGAWYSSWSAMMLWFMIALYLMALYCVPQTPAPGQPDTKP